MLPKQTRLDRVTFQQATKNARQLSCRYFVCKWQPIERTLESRFGVVISQNVCNQAVDRNYKRRQTYEVIRKFLPDLKQRVYMILFARKSLAQAQFQDMQEDIKILFTKLPIT